MPNVSAQLGGFNPGHGEIHGHEGGSMLGMRGAERGEMHGQDRMQGFSLGDTHPQSSHLMGMFHQLHSAIGTFGGGQGMQGQGMQGQGMPGQGLQGQGMQGQGMPGQGVQGQGMQGQGMQATNIQMQALGGQASSEILQHFAQMGGQITGFMDGGSHYGHEQSLSTMQTPFGEAHFGRDAQFSITQSAQMLDVSQFASVPGQNGIAQFGRHTLEQNFANPLQPNNPAHFMNDQQFANIPTLAGQMTYNRSEQAADIPGMSSSHTLSEYENLPAGMQFTGFPQSNPAIQQAVQPRAIEESAPQNVQQGVQQQGMPQDAVAQPAIQAPPAQIAAMPAPVFNSNNNSVTDGRYTLVLNPNDATEVLVADAKTNSNFKISGDPHLINSAGDKASFQTVPLVTTLDEGGQLIFTPGKPNQAGVSTLAQVQWNERGQTATIAGMSGTPGAATITTDMTKQAALPNSAIFLSSGQKGLNQLYIGGANQPQNNQLTNTESEQNLDPYATKTQADA